VAFTPEDPFHSSYN